jgi:glucose-1-phosphate cytidylyltransferase
MKIIILAGGLGSRISEYTKTIPKPMIKIGNKPMVLHIMEHFAKFGFKEFYIAVGYKGDVIKKFFKNKFKKWNINIIETGKNTMTGGRLKKLKKYLKNETFLMTYGDGVSNVNIKKLIKFHKKKKKLVTITAVRPPARFGVLKIKNDKVIYFKEKSKLDEGWINGGFFVMESAFLNYIDNDKTFLEREPLEKVLKKKQLNAYKHNGFWQCMDTKRDKDNLEKIFKNKKF